MPSFENYRPHVGGGLCRVRRSKSGHVKEQRGPEEFRENFVGVHVEGGVAWSRGGILERGAPTSTLFASHGEVEKKQNQESAEYAPVLYSKPVAY